MSPARMRVKALEAQVFDNLPMGVQLFDESGALVSANAAFLDMIGIDDVAQLNQRNLFEDPMLTEEHKGRLRGGEPLRLVDELRLDAWVKEPQQRHQGESPRFVEKSYSPIRTPPSGFMVTVRDVSERINAIDSLKESRSLYQDLVESSDDLIFQCDAVGCYTYLNPAWEKAFGYCVEEMLGRPFSDFMSKEQAEKDKRVLAEILNEGAIRNYQTVHIKKNGEPIHLSLNAKYLKDANGAIAGSRGIATDVTEWKLAEEALMESRQRYEQMVDRSPMGMHFYELQGDALVFTDSNPAADRLLGVDNEQFIGKTIETAFPPLAQTEVPSRYRLAARKGIPWFTEQVAYEDEQIAGAFEVHAFQIGPGKMVAVFLEITARKRAEEGLKNEKERIAVTLRSIGDGVIATNTKGRVILMNKIAERLTGWSADEAIDKPLVEVFHILNELTGEQCENPVDKVLRTSSVVELENHTVLVARDGIRRIIADSGAPIFDAESRIVGVVLVFRDVTEKSKVRETLQRSQKLESLGILAGGIAHDFNNLLGGIFGYIDLAKDMSSESHVQEYLDKAFYTAHRARGLTQQLLTFSKGGAPILKTTNVADLVHQSAKFALSGSNITVRSDFPDDLWLCDIDENQIGQVIDNMAINAQQAMPRGGALGIQGKNVTIAQGAHPSLPPGRYVQIAIEDHGEGISRETLPLIFDPFFTTKQKGSGLGLATSYSIIQKHGGVIDVTSEPGQGTVFLIYLPATQGEGKGASLVPNSVQKGSGSVLVLDDEDFLREVLGGMLERLGYQPICASSGESLIAAYEAAKATDEVVAAILDLTVPGGMGGKETVKVLHDLNPELPVFVASGYSEDPVMCEPERYGFTGSITKPYRKNEICEILCLHLVP